jgi:GNAT superfamily N-acetyltransferase
MVGPDEGVHVALPDGTHVRLRWLRASDGEGLRDLFRRLSTQSRYHRFHAHVSELSPAMWRYLSNVDGNAHFAIVALPSVNEASAPIGVARFIRLPDRPGHAELAITIVDEFHRRGLGRVLLRALQRAAVERGIATFVAHLLPDNVAMKRLLLSAGAKEAPAEHFSVTYELELRPENAGAPRFRRFVERGFKVVGIVGRAASGLMAAGGSALGQWRLYLAWLGRLRREDSMGRMNDQESGRENDRLVTTAVMRRNDFDLGAITKPVSAAEQHANERGWGIGSAFEPVNELETPA